MCLCLCFRASPPPPPSLSLSLSLSVSLSLSRSTSVLLPSGLRIIHLLSLVIPLPSPCADTACVYKTHTHAHIHPHDRRLCLSPSEGHAFTHRALRHTALVHAHTLTNKTHTHISVLSVFTVFTDSLLSTSHDRLIIRFLCEPNLACLSRFPLLNPMMGQSKVK